MKIETRVICIHSRPKYMHSLVLYFPFVTYNLQPFDVYGFEYKNVTDKISFIAKIDRGKKKTLTVAVAESACDRVLCTNLEFCPFVFTSIIIEKNSIENFHASFIITC